MQTIAFGNRWKEMEIDQIFWIDFDGETARTVGRWGFKSWPPMVATPWCCVPPRPWSDIWSCPRASLHRAVAPASSERRGPGAPKNDAGEIVK